MFGLESEVTTLLCLGGVILFYVLGFLHILHALMNTRTAQGTIAWVVCLMAVPFVAIPIFVCPFEY